MPDHHRTGFHYCLYAVILVGGVDWQSQHFLLPHQPWDTDVHCDQDIECSQSIYCQQVSNIVLGKYTIPVPKMIPQRSNQSIAQFYEMAVSNGVSNSMPCKTLVVQSNQNAYSSHQPHK